MKISACILTGLSCAALCALGDPIVIGVQVPGSDHASAPCTPTERTDDYHKNHFSADISGSQGKSFDMVLFGDSITDFWNNPSLALDGDPLNYAAAFNMGIGSDRVQNLLWRLRNGALDGYTTKYFTLMVGINNGHQKCIDHNERADRAEDVAESIRLMLCEMATKHPEAKILLMPILPYSFDSRYFEAAEVTEMSEAVNDYILRFVDNRRVFWVDLRSRYLQRNSMPDKVCYREGGHGGYDAVGLCLHPEFFTYSDFWRPALTNAMRKYLSVPAGRPHVADPSIGYAKAAPNADGAGSATITVYGVYLGSDANANAVTSYSIDYELDGGAKTRALSGQTGTRASFVIPDVALGAHTCRVTVTTADNRELVTLLDFSMTEPWCASPLPTDDSAVRTDGTLKYAYAPSACTVNGVQFAAAGNGNAAASGDIDWPYNMTSGALAPSSVSGAYYEFLNRCWWANQGDKAVTLKNLTAGRSYLVQIFGYRNYNGDGKAHVWIRESYWDPNFIRVYGDGWSCGGTLTGTFTATGSTKTFTVTSDGNYGINGIQVRELGASGESTDVPPGGGEADGGEELTGEFVKKTFIASNKLQLPYRVAAKADPNGGKVPVVVFLHGYGQCGVDNSFTINEMTNIKSYLDGAGGPGGYKLLVPQCPNDVKWAEFSMNSTTCTFHDKPSSALAAVFDLLDSYAAMADVDVNRIYVTGLSMGGHGTWDAICRRPDFFAAAMPCCGGGDPVCAADIAHVPVLAVHNRGDPTIPCEQTENMVTALRALGSDVIFEKLENNSHDAWTACYSRTDDVEPGEPNHRFVWLFAQNRATNNRPKCPRITELTASPSGSSATISLAGVVLGTDADSVPATGYSVAYRLDGASSAVTALSGQAADSSFTLEGLADGNHTCEVTITTDKGRTKTKSVVFYVNTSAVSDVWTSGYMDAEGNSFSTEGTLRYAYSTLGATVNGIRFERDVTLQGSSLKISFVPNIDNFDGSFMNEGVGGDFGLVLGNGWYWNGNESGTHTVTLTLSNLEGGRKYLVQFLSHSYWNNTTTVSANGCEPVHIHGDSAESGKYGALVTGVFTADSATKDVTVIYQGGSGKMPFNAVQVRELPGGESGGVNPAPVVYFENSAAADGVLTLEIPKAANEPCCFYRIVAE